MAADRIVGLNSPFWSPRGLARVCGGAWRCAPNAGDDTHSITGVSIDTRSMRAGELFIALRGERFDGHDFVQEALARGAVGALVERGATQLADVPDAPLLEVDDTLAAMHRLARAWRDALHEGGCTLIAVAGSNGKTTTRNLIHHLLDNATVGSRALRGTQSPKSFNNHIGVPVTLLGAAAEDDFLVVEIGTNRPGEVAQLGELVRPDIAVIVSIGHEHLEALGTIEGVAREELSLLRCVVPGGTALVPDEDWLTPWMPETTHAVCIERVRRDALLEQTLTLPGAHALDNASFAARVARMMGVGDDHIAAALARAEPMPGRFAVRRIGPLTLIDDTYNANPDSVRAALATLMQRWADARRRVFVFGDMKELGDASIEAHRAVGQQVARSRPGFSLLVTVGPLATFAAAELRRLQPEAHVHAVPEWNEALPQCIAAMLEPGDVVLLKASRSMALDRVIPAIEGAFGERAMCG